MNNLTPDGLKKIQDIATRFGLHINTVQNMLQAVENGGGTMAQFNIPELGGGGQWMQGGMTMVGDMFNYSLQGTVSNLCSELANLIFSQNIFEAPTQSRGPFQNSGNWWPERFGNPASSGSQNNFKYGYFPEPVCRLAIETNGQLFIYNTLNHHISGVSQQQGGTNNFSVSSQFGTIDISSLPLILENATTNEPIVVNSPIIPVIENLTFQSENLPQNNPISDVKKPEIQAIAPDSKEEDIFLLIEKLAGLLKKGFITESEFQTKKTDLLNRL